MKSQTTMIQTTAPIEEAVAPLDSLVQTKSTLLHESGQASIEFILTVIFTLAISLLFIALAINTTKGFLAHYATFMASRTYLTYEVSNKEAGTNINAAKAAAKEALDRYELPALGIDDSNFKIISDGSEIFTGATLTFEQLLSPLSVIANGVNATFHSESFLGKEPLRTQCVNSICEAMTGTQTCSPENVLTLMDNGC